MDNIISPFTGSSNNVSHKSAVYDDVFGAAPTTARTLAPRLDDYSEIFVGGSRSFSIPVLDLPLLTDDDDSIHFDYAQVFGGVSAPGYEHDDDPWSPAQSGSMSDEFDPDKSLRSSDADAHHSLQFNASYNNNSTQSNIIGTVLTGTTTYVTNFTFSHYDKSHVSCDEGEDENENCSVTAIHDKRVAQDKQHAKCDSNLPEENHEYFTCKPFMTVSDISLRTKPSRLPPPSRPPPALAVNKGDNDTSYLKLKASKSCNYSFESLTDDTSSLSFDVKLVAATLPPEGTGNGNKDVDNYDGAVAWREKTDYFEVIEKIISEQTFDIIEDSDIHMNTDAYKHPSDTGSNTLKEAQGLEKQRRQPELTSEQKEIQNTRPSDQKGFQEKVIQSKMTSQHSLNNMAPKDFQQFGERDMLPTEDSETVEMLPKGEGNWIEVDARSKLEESLKGLDIEKKSVDTQMTRQHSEKHNQNIHKEECQRILENVKGAENRDQQLSCEVGIDDEKLFEVGIQIKNELICRDYLQQVRNEKEEVTKERNRDASKVKDTGLRFRRVDTDPDHSAGFFVTKGHINLIRTAGVQKVLHGNAKEIEPIECSGHEEEAELTATTVSRKQYNEGNGQLKSDLNSINCEGKPIGFSKNKNEGISVNITSSSQAIQDSTAQFISKTVDVKDSFVPCQVIRESSTVNGMKEKHSDDTLHSIKNITSQKIEIKDYNNIKENLPAKDHKVGERIRREIELENEHIRKIEEEKEREKERQKDRMAVNKAALESCERSYTEARERAAVDRATAEVRQRTMAAVRETLKNSSMDTKLRTERAASEARQRVAEKSMSQKAASEAHFRVERSASFKYSDTRQSSLSSDTHLKSTGISSNLRYSYSFGHAGADSESPQRCKARLERYRRTAERAANALAEKNMRDLLVQREREEIDRVAEILDSEIKRWSGGKEANLRALLSTLQYILGPDSGWQPVPLTEVITCAAVKRAYRKATLCVHPDKLQQRGATIQQKYICEKVFDLLKEAWNKFNSEEM